MASVRKLILVVDDDPEIRELAVILLRGAGYHVRQAASGIEALSEARDSSPELVLLDVNLPDMDGWEVLRILRSDEDLRNLPVMMFTVHGEVRDKVHALQDGAQDYIQKPFSHDELLDRVGRILDGMGVAR
jgi:DNA-binding response OmpR family regulator